MCWKACLPPLQFYKTAVALRGPVCYTALKVVFMRTIGLLLLFLSLPVLAATVGWRNDGTGRYPAAAPQMAWGPAERVLWATPLPNWSNASPVVVGERIFVTAEPDTLLCLDRTGTILWQKSNGYEELLPEADRAKLQAERQTLAQLERERGGQQRQLRGKSQDLRRATEEAKLAPEDAAKAAAVDGLQHEVNNLQEAVNQLDAQIAALPLAGLWRLPVTHPSNGYASNTPVSDGTHIYVSFGTGITACYTLDGTRKWIRLVERPKHEWGHSCSPVLVGDSLIIQYVDTFALNAATGEVRWQAKHPHIWGTPSPVRLGKIDALYTDCGEVINVSDGKTLAATGMKLEFGSPYVEDNIAYCASGNMARAFRLDAREDGTVGVTKLWETAVPNERYYAAPLLHDGLLYLINQQGWLSVLDAATGTKAYESLRLPLAGVCYSAPVLAGNVIIFGSDSGKSAVITPGRTFNLLANPALDPYRSTAVCDGARMYLRTCVPKSKLYCIGEP